MGVSVWIHRSLPLMLGVHDVPSHGLSEGALRVEPHSTETFQPQMLYFGKHINFCHHFTKFKNVNFCVMLH